MRRSFGKLLPASLAALVLASFAIAPYADPPPLGAAAVGAVVVLAPQAAVGWRSRCRRRWRRRQAECARRQQQG